MHLLRFPLAAIVLLLGFAFSATTAQAQLSVTKEEHTVTARLNGEILTVLYFGSDAKKPYFYPLVGPDAFTLLEKQLVTDEPGVPGRKVLVASTNPRVQNQSDDAPDLQFGDVVTITGDTTGEWLQIADSDSAIARGDVAPLAATVTRQIRKDPPQVTDQLSPDYYDHSHHKGIWVAVDEVNGIGFWNEKGTIATQRVEVLETTGDPVRIRVVNHWLDAEMKPLLIERTLYYLFANRMLGVETTLEARADVTFGDTKEGMFAIRLPNSMRELVSQGPVLNADGLQGTTKIWGKVGRWVDYNGMLGGQTFGVTIMDHPRNPWASRYHVRNYGLFAINPFGDAAYTQHTDSPRRARVPVLKQGESLTFRYALWVHGGSTSTQQIESIYARFVKEL